MRLTGSAAEPRTRLSPGLPGSPGALMGHRPAFSCSGADLGGAGRDAALRSGRARSGSRSPCELAPSRKDQIAVGRSTDRAFPRVLMASLAPPRAQGGLRTQADRAEADALLALSSSSGSLPGAHQVRHHRMAISHLEGLHFLLEGPIGLGHALMLAQVFEPILGDEGLDVASWVGRVDEVLPEECAITATHLTEPLQDFREL